jgi:hypothetical protein
MIRFRHLLPAAFACAAAGALAAEGTVSLDLNKLEPTADGCRMHMVVTNPTSKAFEKYLLDLVIFDTKGVVAQRTALDVSPVRPNKTSVYAFNVKAVACERFGRVLLNDVTGCAGGSGQAVDCVATVSVSSQSGVELFK